MLNTPPEVVAQIDNSRDALLELMSATATYVDRDPAAIKDLIRQLIENFGPAILSWILALLTPQETPDQS
jgi:hypothetical protein